MIILAVIKLSRDDESSYLKMDVGRVLYGTKFWSNSSIHGHFKNEHLTEMKEKKTTFELDSFDLDLHVFPTNPLP